MKTSQLEERLSAEEEFDEDLIRENGCPDFCTVITEYIKEKGIPRSELIKRMNINMNIDKNYGYQLLNGTRAPTRNHTIQIGLLLGLDIGSFQALLKAAKKKPLYVRDMFDAKVFYAVKHKMELDKAIDFIWNT